MKVSFLFCASTIALVVSPLAAEPTTIQGSKSNSDYRMASPENCTEQSAKATTIKGSKSNSDFRMASPKGDTGQPEEAKNYNSSRSNTSMTVTPDGETGQPAEATTINGSKSNSDARMARLAVGEDPRTNTAPPCAPAGK